MRRAMLMLLCAALLAGCALAETGGDYQWRALEDGTCEITKYTGTAAEAVIPDSLGGMPVSGLGLRCFAKTGVTRVEIPDGVVSLGSMCFSECAALETVILPPGLREVGSWAFEGTALISLELPEGVTAVGNYCFSECRGLESVRLPDSLTKLGDCAFMMCTALEEIALPDSLTEMGDNPFCYCTALTEIRFSPQHPALRMIGDALYYDYGLPAGPEGPAGPRLVCRLCAAGDAEFQVAEGCRTIGRFALANNRGLESVTLPETVTAVDDYAFFHCTALRSVVIPATVESVGTGCFELCTDAVRIVTPEGSPAYEWAVANGVGLRAPGSEDPTDFTERTDDPAERTDDPDIEYEPTDGGIR